MGRIGQTMGECADTKELHLALVWYRMHLMPCPFKRRAYRPSKHVRFIRYDEAMIDGRNIRESDIFLK